MAESNAAKGKTAEKAVTKKLKELSASKDWWYHRLPDASVCRGRLPKQPADYMVMYRGAPCLLEVKENGNSKPRFPLSRFTQIPKMRIFSMAKGLSLFIILRTDINEWYLLDIADVMVDSKSLNLDTFVSFPDIDFLFRKIQQVIANWKRP